MILLDTNVVSAVMAPAPPREVIDWLNQQPTVDLYLSAITVAEIGYGLWILPRGKRRRAVQERFQRFVSEGFEQRILVFDEPAARMYGEVMGNRRQLGRPLSVPDGQIAAIARVHHFAVATRNVRDFEACGLELINPFDGAQGIDRR